MKEDKKFYKAVIVTILAVVTIFGYLALLNGRYMKIDCGYVRAFDKWKAVYIPATPDEVDGNLSE